MRSIPLSFIFNSRPDNHLYFVTKSTFHLLLAPSEFLDEKL